jgi:hypothetical protein
VLLLLAAVGGALAVALASGWGRGLIAPIVSQIFKR